MTRFLVILGALLCLQGPLAAAERPNILLILVDDLGYGDLSSYGAPDVRTPHIDGLMASGLRFDQFYANCPVCSPTRAALMTGLYPDRAGVPGVIRTPLEGKVTSWGNLRDDVPLLPAVLKTAGYHTGIVGKWHLGLEKPDRPSDRGFDHFHGFLGDMMDDYETHLRHDRNYLRLNETEITAEGHATDLFSQWAIEYIQDRQGKSPWFLYLAYNAPHSPIQPPAAWLEKVKQREPGIDEDRAKLAALIEHLDDGIGNVLESIKGTNTLVVFTSDNGGDLRFKSRNTPFNGSKQDMLEGGIRVCTGVAWPGQIAPGGRSDFAGLTMDFFPTLAEIAGAKLPSPVDGISFAQLLLGQPFSAPERPLFWVRLEGGAAYGGLPYHAVRIGDFKLLRNGPFEPYQMFNLQADPAEASPIPRSKAPKRYDELFQALLIHVQDAGKYPWH